MTSQNHPLMTTAEVAAFFRVDIKTVSRWGVTGKLEVVTTPGGQRGRFFRGQVEAIANGATLTPAQIQELWDQWAETPL